MQNTPFRIGWNSMQSTDRDLSESTERGFFLFFQVLSTASNTKILIERGRHCMHKRLLLQVQSFQLQSSLKIVLQHIFVNKVYPPIPYISSPHTSSVTGSFIYINLPINNDNSLTNKGVYLNNRDVYLFSTSTMKGSNIQPQYRYQATYKI